MTAQAGGSKCSSIAGLNYWAFTGGVSCDASQAQYYDWDPAGTAKDIGSMLWGEAKGAGKFVLGFTPIPTVSHSVQCLFGGWSRMQECAQEARDQQSALWDAAKDVYVRSQAFNLMTLGVLTGDVSVADTWDYGYQLARDYSFGSTLDACKTGEYDKCGEGTSEAILTVGLFFIPGGTATRAPKVVDAAADAARAANTGLSSDLAALSQANVANSGKTVIGSYPGYVASAEARGASYFSIGDEWDALVARGQDPWALNQHFLDGRIAAGDTVYSTVPRGSIDPASTLLRETQYLQGNG